MEIRTKIIIGTLFILLILVLGLFLPRVGNHQQAYISLTFDDGYTDVYNNVLPILEKYKIAGTFYIIAGLVGKEFEGQKLMNWREIKELEKRGNEVGSHTFDHPYLTKLNEASVKKELGQSKKILQEKGFNATSLAIPYGDYNKKVEKIAKKYYSSVRTSKWGINSFLSIDKYNLMAMPVRKVTKLSEVKSWIDKCQRSNGWLILMFHLVRKNKKLEYSISPNDLKEIIKYIKRENIKIKTVSEVLKIVGKNKSVQ